MPPAADTAPLLLPSTFLNYLGDTRLSDCTFCSARTQCKSRLKGKLPLPTQGRTSRGAPGISAIKLRTQLHILHPWARPQVPLISAYCSRLSCPPTMVPFQTYVMLQQMFSPWSFPNTRTGLPRGLSPSLKTTENQTKSWATLPNLKASPDLSREVDHRIYQNKAYRGFLSSFGHRCYLPALD